MASTALLSQWQATGLCSRDRSHDAAVDGICFGRPANLKADRDPTQIVMPHVIMVTLGYKLMSEEHGPNELNNAHLAEQAGFDVAAISDHVSPWLEEQGHAPLAWPVLGAVDVRSWAKAD
jgi:hypothetical protein